MQDQPTWGSNFKNKLQWHHPIHQLDLHLLKAVHYLLLVTHKCHSQTPQIPVGESRHWFQGPPRDMPPRASTHCVRRCCCQRSYHVRLPKPFTKETSLIFSILKHYFLMVYGISNGWGITSLAKGKSWMAKHQQHLWPRTPLGVNSPISKRKAAWESLCCSFLFSWERLVFGFEYEQREERSIHGSFLFRWGKAKDNTNCNPRVSS